MMKFIMTDASIVGQKRKQPQRACDQCRQRKTRCEHDIVMSDRQVDVTQRACDQCRKRKKRCEHKVDNDVLSNRQGNLTPQSSNVLQSPVSAGPEAAENPPSDPLPGSVNTENEGPHGQQGSNSPVDNGPTVLENSNRGGASALPRSQDGVVQEIAKIHNSSLGSRFIGDLNPEGVFLAAISSNAGTRSSHQNKVGIWVAENQSTDASKRSTSSSAAARKPKGLFSGFEPLVQTMILPLLEEQCLSMTPPETDWKKLYAIYRQKYHSIFPVLDLGKFDTLESTQPASILLKQGICLVASMDLGAKDHLRLPNMQSSLPQREFGQRLSTAMRTNIEMGLVSERIILIQALILLSFFIEGPEAGDSSSQLCGKAVHLTHSIGLHLHYHGSAHRDKYAETLLCCVWAQDRINAALHGRPVLMHERDMETDVASFFPRQSPCFQLFLRVVMLLDAVIDLYRPSKRGSDVAWEGDFPSFDDLILRSDATQVPAPLLASTEMLYHAVAILSCRSKRLEESPNSSAARVRQSFSANQVTLIMGRDLRDQLSVFPFVSYAVSLSLSVAYRDMRHSKVSLFRRRARSQLQTNCDILRELGEISWSASLMADMGQATIREMDRVYSVMANAQQRDIGRESHPPLQNSTPESNSETRTLVDAGVLQLLHDSAALELPRSEVFIRLTITGDAGHNTGILRNDDSASKALEYNSMFNMPEFDVFGLFDPSFNLDSVDACLEGNLDPSHPTGLLT